VKTHTIAVDPKAPQADVVGQAVAALRRGGLVAFPTDTLYALGADALAADAVERVLTVKGRARGKPLSVLVPSVDAIASLDVALAAGVPEALRAFWPGPLTVVVKASVMLKVLPGVQVAGAPLTTTVVSAPSLAVQLSGLFPQQFTACA